MKTNVGSYDGAVRFVGGCILLMMGNHSLGWWGLLGLLPILSSITGFCAVYAIFHLDTTGCDQDHESFHSNAVNRLAAVHGRLGTHAIPSIHRIRHG